MCRFNRKNLKQHFNLINEFIIICNVCSFFVYQCFLFITSYMQDYETSSSISLLQSNTSTTGSQTVPTKVLGIAAYASTTRWTLWLDRLASASAWASSNSTCCFPVSSHCGLTHLKCPTASERTARSVCSTSPFPAPTETPAPPLETASPPQSPRCPRWWKVTSAARRNYWFWAAPAPLNPTWWLCPAKWVTEVIF